MGVTSCVQQLRAFDLRIKAKAGADAHGKEASVGYKLSGRKERHCQRLTSFPCGARLRTGSGLHQRVQWTCGRTFCAKLTSRSIPPKADQHKTNEQILDRSAVLANGGKCDYRLDESTSEELLSSSKSGRRLITQALLAATLVALAAPPPSAEAVQLQIIPEANIVASVAKQAAGIAQAVQQNKVLEMAAEQVELQVRSLFSPQVRELLKQTGEYLHLPTTDSIASTFSSSVQSLQSSSEQLKTTLESDLQSLRELAGSLPPPSSDLKTLQTSLSDLAGRLSVDSPLQRQLQTLQTSLEEAGKGGAALKEALLRAQQELGVFQEKVASGEGKLEQPVQNAIGDAQDSVNAALDYLGRVAGDALNLVPIRSPSLTAAAEATVQRLGLFELWTLLSGFIVAQGERWLVLGPGLVLLAAGWNAFKKKQRERRREEKRLQGPSPAVRLRSARVQRELVKLQVKGQLFDAVKRLGKASLAASTDPASVRIRGEVESLIKQLRDTRVPPDPTLLGASASDPFADLSPAPDIDGSWQLVYSSEPLETRGLSPGPLSGLLPDFAMDAVTQRVTSREQGSFSAGVPQPAPVKFAENSARLT